LKEIQGGAVLTNANQNGSTLLVRPLHPVVDSLYLSPTNQAMQDLVTDPNATQLNTVSGQWTKVMSFPDKKVRIGTDNSSSNKIAVWWFATPTAVSVTIPIRVYIRVTFSVRRSF